MQPPTSRPPDPPMIGPYQVLSLLGEGGFGRVFKVQSQHGLTLALKQLLTRDTEQLARFEREQRLLEELNQEHGFVPVVDKGHSQQGPYLVMPLLDSDLSQRLKNEGPLPWREAVDIVSRLARSMGFAHERGIVHRDLKPHNVLFSQGSPNEPYIADMGLSKHFDRSQTQDGVSLSLSAHDKSYGSVAYMAPEQSEDFKNVGPRADVFSLAVILFECLTGQLPFGKDNALAIMVRIGKGDISPLSELCPDCPRDLVELIEQNLSHDQKDRLAGGSELAEALRDALEQSTAARMSPFVLATFVLAALVLPLLLFVAVLGFVAWSPSKTRSPKPQASKARPTKAPAVKDPVKVDREEPPFQVLSAKQLPALLRPATQGRVLKLRRVIGSTRGSHKSMIASGLLSADGQLCLSSDLSGVVRSWEPETGHERGYLKAHDGFAYSLCLSPDNKTLVFGREDGAVQFVNPEKLESQHVERIGSMGVFDVKLFDQGRQLVCCCGRDVVLMDVEKRTVTTRVRLGQRLVKRGLRNIAVAEGAEPLFVATSYDSRLLIFKIVGGQAQLLNSMDTNGHGFCVAVDSSQKYALVGTTKGHLYHLSLSDFKVIPFKGLKRNRAYNHLRAVAWFKDGRFATGGDDNFVRVWRIENAKAKLLTEWEAHASWIGGLCLSVDERKLMTVSNDMTVQIWDVATESRLWPRDEHSGAIFSAHQVDEGRIVTAGGDAQLRDWSLDPDELPKVRSEPGKALNVSRPQFCHDPSKNSLIFYGFKTLQFDYKLDSKSLDATILKGVGKSFPVICSTASGGRALVSLQGGSLLVIDTKRGATIKTLRVSKGVAVSATMDHSRQQAWLVTHTGSLYVLDMATLRLRFGGVLRSATEKAPIVCGFATAIEQLAITEARDRVKVFEVSSQQSLQSLPIPIAYQPLTAVALSPKGELVVGAAAQGLLVWSTKSGQVIETLDLSKLHDLPLFLSFSDFAPNLLMGSARGLLTVWRINSAAKLIAK